MLNTNLLIIDDDIDTSNLIVRILKKEGYNIFTAASAEEGLDLVKEKEIELILCDWVLPKMNGPELCHKLRNEDFEDYIYIILLTGKSDKEDITFGMNSGADDFLTKPFHNDELRARIKAGTRHIFLKKSLQENNALLKLRNKELANAYVRMRNDLQTAVYFQQSLLPQPGTLQNAVVFESLYVPSELTSGDTFNYFELDQKTIGFYIIDVCGHGVSAAMISYALNKSLSPDSIPNSLLKEHSPTDNSYSILSPAKALERMNQFYQSQNEIIAFYTAIYGIYDRENATLTISHAGHPDALYLPVDGSEIIALKSKGAAIGLIPMIQYENIQIQVKKGSRMYIYSDGITEASNSENGLFGIGRLSQLILDSRNLSLSESIKFIENELRKWNSTGSEFSDDVTIFAMEFI